MDFELSEDQSLFRDAARTFSDKEFAPRAAEWDAGNIFPRAVIGQAGKLGFCGLYCPPEFGGMGLSRLDSSIILEQLAMGCTSTTAYISIHNMATWMVASFGTADTRKAWVPDLASGKLLSSYCMT